MPQTRQVRGCDVCRAVQEIVIDYVDGTGSDDELHRVYVGATCVNGHPYDVSKLHAANAG